MTESRTFVNRLGIDAAVSVAANYARMAVDMFNPDHIVTMVSGGKDSAAAHMLAVEIGLPVSVTVHGRTGCGIQETTDFVSQHYAQNLVIADAGTAYEDYVLRKGFFGKGLDAHGFAYRILKATPFRKAISAEMRQRKRGVRVLLINGARKDESANRQAHLRRARPDPAANGNVWFNIIHDWSQELRDAYLESRGVPINPVAKALCRSGECMCGTTQTAADRVEAAALYPKWGAWLDSLEAEARSLHGWGWGETAPKKLIAPATFQPMCVGCTRTVTETQEDIFS